MSNVAWLFVAFAIVWVALGAYLLTIHTRQKDLERRIEELQHSHSQHTHKDAS